MYAALTFFGQGKLICKSSSAADNGKTVSVTDGKKSWSAIMTDGVCTFTLPAKQKYTVCLLNGDNAEYVTDVIFGFGDCKELEVGMDKTSWKGLKAILNAGLETEMLAVGDQISATVAGEEQVFDIVHIDYRPSVYGRNIILAKHSALKEERVFSTESDSTGGYAATSLAKYLDDGYYNSLPNDMKSVITKMTYKGAKGNKNNDLQTEEHMIWLPLETNIFGNWTNASPQEGTNGGAEQFSYFATSANRVRTWDGTGSPCYWWLGSPSHAGYNVFCLVSNAGCASYQTMNTVSTVIPFFMIAADAE